MAAAARRKRRFQMAVGGGLSAAAIAAVVLAISASGGSGLHTTNAQRAAAVATGNLTGLQSTPAPWQPEYPHLADRLAELHLPANGDESYHVHAHLSVYVNGQQVPVPGNVGITATLTGGIEATMHTHDTSGIIHMEAGNPYPFKVSDFLDVWGVKFTDTQLGAYTDRGQDRVWMYVNGKPISDPVTYVLRPHDNVVLAYGRAGSFPTNVPFNWPPGV